MIRKTVNLLISFLLFFSVMFFETVYAEPEKNYLEIGKEHYKFGNLNAAISALNEHLSSHPDDINAHYYIALALYRTNQHKSAIEHFKFVAEKEPDTPTGIYCSKFVVQSLVSKKEVTKESGFAGFKFKDQIVIKVFKDSPAEKAGIKVGDQLLSVDKISVSGLSATATAKLVIGPIDTIVIIKVKREGKEIIFPVKRGKIYPEAEKSWGR